MRRRHMERRWLHDVQPLPGRHLEQRHRCHLCQLLPAVPSWHMELAGGRARPGLMPAMPGRPLGRRPRPQGRALVHRLPRRNLQRRHGRHLRRHVHPMRRRHVEPGPRRAVPGGVQRVPPWHVDRPGWHLLLLRLPTLPRRHVELAERGHPPRSVPGMPGRHLELPGGCLQQQDVQRLLRGLLERPCRRLEPVRLHVVPDGHVE
mmetsp:Transcript_52457/g.135387  ORF Transcript_52457/g.135387 Transcript_52457/m.135387 type:complete len:204 (+) Transcript_52457:136-747(+)